MAALHFLGGNGILTVTHRTSIIIHQLANLDKRWQEHVWGTRVFSHMLPWDWNLDPGQSPKHMQGTWISSFVCTTCMSEPGSLLRASKGTALQRLLAFPLRPTRVTVAFGTNWLDDDGGANGLCSPDNSTINPHFALSISIHASTANRCFRGVRVATSTGAYSAISSPVLEMRKILGSAKGYTVIEAPCCWEIHVRADARAFLVARTRGTTLQCPNFGWSSSESTGQGNSKAGNMANKVIISILQAAFYAINITNIPVYYT